jgi:hypothetical protein
MLLFFFCYQKSYSFSLPAFHEEDGNFLRDKTGERIPLYETDADGNNRRRVRKVFEFKLLPDYEKKTEHGKMVEYRSCFELKKDSLYYNDLLKKLATEATKAESPIYTEEEYIKKENPEKYEMATQFADERSQYQAQIESLQTQLEKLSKGRN